MADLKAIHKELDLVQDVIKRMADNSFKVKAWMMSIFGAVLALAKSGLLSSIGGVAGNDDMMGYIALFLVATVLVFWYLDAFFLRTEKLYRELYKWVVNNRPHTDAYLYDLNTFVREVDGRQDNLLARTPSVFKVMLSKTLLPFYILPLLLSLLILFTV